MPLLCLALAGKFLSGARRVGVDEEDVFFPNLVVRQRDKAHGVQRVTSRAWMSDPYMKGLIDKLVLDKSAISQRVRWSPVFRSRYAKYVAELTGNQKCRIKDLAAAKHRFSSTQQPLSRAVLYFVPLLRCAQSILDERSKSSAEGRDAHAWLSSMNDESALMMAMMADCADESISLCRFFDRDNYDKSAVTHEVNDYLKRVTWLFGSETQGALKTGYTKYMVDTLASSRRTIMLDGKPTFIGGPNKPALDVISSCFKRMQNWLQLCRHTIRAEVPEFETLQTFECFNLTGRVTESTYTSLRQLGTVLKLDLLRLKAQFEDVRPLAERHAENRGLSTELAWKAALFDVRRSARSRIAHPVDVLEEALARLVAWNASTTNVERRFAKAYCTTSGSRGDVGEARMDDEAVLLMPTPNDAAICEELLTQTG